MTPYEHKKDHILPEMFIRRGMRKYGIFACGETEIDTLRNLAVVSVSTY